MCFVELSTAIICPLDVFVCTEAELDGMATRPLARRAKEEGRVAYGRWEAHR